MKTKFSILLILLIFNSFGQVKLEKEVEETITLKTFVWHYKSDVYSVNCFEDYENRRKKEGYFQVNLHFYKKNLKLFYSELLNLQSLDDGEYELSAKVISTNPSFDESDIIAKKKGDKIDIYAIVSSTNSSYEETNSLFSKKCDKIHFYSTYVDDPEVIASNQCNNVHLYPLNKTLNINDIIDDFEILKTTLEKK